MPTKNLPQTDAEMLQSASKSRQTRIYKGIARDINTQTISMLTAQTAAELENLATPTERIALKDTDAVQSVSIRYVQACSDAGVLPTMSGLAKALGVTRSALYEHIRSHPNDDTSRWLEEFSDTCGEAMMQAALYGAVSPVPAIFVAKARYGFRDTLTIETMPHADNTPQKPPAELLEYLSAIDQIDE